MRSPDYYRYFVGPKDAKFWNFNSPVVAIKGNEGFNFKKNFELENYDFEFEHYIQKWEPDYLLSIGGKEISFSKFISYINPDCRKNVYKFLKIKPNFKKPKLIKEKNKIFISKLIEQGAFNGDKAYKCDEKDLEYFYEMSQKKLIHVSPLDETMFYLKDK